MQSGTRVAGKVKSNQELLPGQCSMARQNYGTWVMGAPKNGRRATQKTSWGVSRPQFSTLLSSEVATYNFPWLQAASLALSLSLRRRILWGTRIGPQGRKPASYITYSTHRNKHMDQAQAAIGFGGLQASRWWRPEFISPLSLVQLLARLRGTPLATGRARRLASYFTRALLQSSYFTFEGAVSKAFATNERERESRVQSGMRMLF